MEDEAKRGGNRSRLARVRLACAANDVRYCGFRIRLSTLELEDSYASIAKKFRSKTYIHSATPPSVLRLLGKREILLVFAGQVLASVQQSE